MRALLIALCLLLVACENEAKQAVMTDNQNFKVELLFEVDGCKVYRFMDYNRSRYFCTCQGSVQWTEKHGKTSVPREVPTAITDSKIP